MTSTVAVVCVKEVLDNARDRRTLFSAMLLGPLFGPLIFAVLVNVMLSQTLASLRDTLAVPAVEAQQAPNLQAFLAQRGIEFGPGPANLAEAVERVSRGEHELIVVLDEGFAEAFSAGRETSVILVFDQSNTRAAGRLQRVQQALQAYAEQLRVMRIIARGIHPAVLEPFRVEPLDVSTAAGRSVLLLGMLTYFMLLATLMGGFYLAIDTTAGERERGSLEPLLTVPLERGSLLAGKMAATVCYMLLSLALTIAAFTIALRFVPLERLGMSSGIQITTALAVFAVLLPFVPLGAALMTLVASFTRSYKEAQTYLTLVLLVPTLPLIVATLLNVRGSAALMWVPSLSQHLLVTSLIRHEPIALGHVAISAGSTLLVGALCAWLAARLYRREGLLA